MGKTRKLGRNKKGMSMILSALLLVVIVVVMGSMVYAWSTGLMGGFMKEPASTGEALALDNANIVANSTATLYLRNIGDTSVQIDAIYISGTDGQSGTGTPSITDINVNQVGTCVVTPSGLAFVSGYSYEFKIVSAAGSQFVFTVKS